MNWYVTQSSIDGIYEKSFFLQTRLLMIKNLRKNVDLVTQKYKGEWNDCVCTVCVRHADVTNQDYKQQLI